MDAASFSTLGNTGLVLTRDPRSMWFSAFSGCPALAFFFLLLIDLLMLYFKKIKIDEIK